MTRTRWASFSCHSCTASVEAPEISVEVSLRRVGWQMSPRVTCPECRADT